jgi:hypothetical protein
MSYGGYGHYSHQWPVDQKPKYKPYPSYSSYGQFSHQWPIDNRPVFTPHQTVYTGHPYKPPQAPVAPPPGWADAQAAAASDPNAHQTGANGQPIDPSQLDFSNDPILMRVRALNEQMIAAAKAQELLQRKQALIDFGDPALAAKLLGAGDSATALAAGENPFSATRQLRDTHDQNVLGIDEGRNKQNLFYSSTRGADLTGEGGAYLQSQANAQTDLNHALDAYHQVELGVEQSAAQGLLSAQEAAYQRALQWWLAQAGQAQGQQAATTATGTTATQGGGNGSQYQGQQHGSYWWW